MNRLTFAGFSMLEEAAMVYCLWLRCFVAIWFLDQAFWPATLIELGTAKERLLESNLLLSSLPFFVAN